MKSKIGIYFFDSKEHMWAFLNSPAGQKMLADLAPSGFVGLCWYDGGARSFYANYPINICSTNTCACPRSSS